MSIQHYVKTATPGIAVLQGLLCLLPVGETYWLYRLAQRAAVLIGHWPIATQNDPKWIGPHDAIYQHLWDVVDDWEGPAFFSFFVWLVFYGLLWRFYTNRVRLALAVVFWASWLLLWFNPWDLLFWWTD